MVLLILHILDPLSWSVYSRNFSFILGILGHLAHELKTDDISQVVNGGPGLAFISYPEAIARFDFAPQVVPFFYSTRIFIYDSAENKNQQLFNCFDKAPDDPIQ